MLIGTILLVTIIGRILSPMVMVMVTLMVIYYILKAQYGDPKQSHHVDPHH
jgi:branched-subunit amino acid permease